MQLSLYLHVASTPCLEASSHRLLTFLPLFSPLSAVRFYAVSLPRLPSFSSKQLAATLAALGSLSAAAGGSCPPQAWSAAALAAVSARLATLSAPGLCDTMWGLGELRLVPDKEAMQRWVGGCGVCCAVLCYCLTRK